ncbi:hypothetical protein DASC09_062280 [Saccharomycopsis crataegensis]|uniref:Glutathione transferase n=1 Tax=Saccharomycopsis crataegensis TaxID=43959 RepID=A0AAV5QW12_9ASCO|nr:hypothetical protein DASC09_062280 [Saccharomycopsis crataegensis]
MSATDSTAANHAAHSTSALASAPAATTTKTKTAATANTTTASHASADAVSTNAIPSAGTRDVPSEPPAGTASDIPGVSTGVPIETTHTEVYPKITVHWLNHSRATRVLWLLEELGLKYDIKTYQRDKYLHAPESLKSVYPLGKSPVVEVQKTADSTPVVLAESGYVFQWVLREFDAGKLRNKGNRDKVDYYLHYGEGSLQPPLLFEAVLQLVEKAFAPWPISAIKKGLVNKIRSAYCVPETTNNLEFLEKELSKGGGYFAGSKLSAADIMLSYPLDVVVHRGVKLDEFPEIKKWVAMIKENANFQAARKYGSDT